jgi:hypothetical protein
MCTYRKQQYYNIFPETREISSVTYLISDKSCSGNFNHSSNFVANGFTHSSENFVSGFMDKRHLVFQFLEN